MSPSHFIRPAIAAALGLLTTALVGAAAGNWVAPQSNVSYRAALFDAMLVAMQRSDRFVVRTAGDSMTPFFGADTLAVVQRMDVARLRPGMIAVYRNRDGEEVAHRVIETTASGWRVQGYNNTEADSTMVTAENFAGVLYATFQTAGYDETATGPTDASAALPVVLGAPAK